MAAQFSSKDTAGLISAVGDIAVSLIEMGSAIMSGKRLEKFSVIYQRKRAETEANLSEARQKNMIAGLIVLIAVGAVIGFVFYYKKKI